MNTQIITSCSFVRAIICELVINYDQKNAPNVFFEGSRFPSFFQLTPCKYMNVNKFDAAPFRFFLNGANGAL